MEDFLEMLLDRQIDLETLLERHAGLSPVDVAALRKQLRGTRLLEGCETLLRLRRVPFPSSDTLERECTMAIRPMKPSRSNGTIAAVSEGVGSVSPAYPDSGLQREPIHGKALREGKREPAVRYQETPPAKLASAPMQFRTFYKLEILWKFWVA
jgi:hypothetical protein